MANKSDLIGIAASILDSPAPDMQSPSPMGPASMSPQMGQSMGMPGSMPGSMPQPPTPQCPEGYSFDEDLNSCVPTNYYNKMDGLDAGQKTKLLDDPNFMQVYLAKKSKGLQLPEPPAFMSEGDNNGF